MTVPGAAFDVAVIGAGVVGAAIARELGRYRLRCVWLEAGGDVATATSKANTALLHTGFDAKPGSLEARLVRRGFELLGRYAPAAGIALEPLGALMIAWNPEELAALPAIAATAARNGYDAAQLLPGAELYRREPHLGPGALGALAIPDESIICPFSTPLAFATEAVLNGVDLRLGCPVETIAAGEDGLHVLGTPGAPLRCRFVVNAAGLYADTLERMLGHRRFTVVPRRGELIVFDKLARPLVNHILLPVPTAAGKGVIVSPTVFGNVLLGPTAEDVPDKTATASTAAGIAALYEKGRRILPELMAEEVTALYAGLRAATEHGDYQIHFDRAARSVCVGGIRSTGLSASLAIAEYVVAGLAAAGLTLAPRQGFRSVRMPPLGENATRPYQSAEAIAANPDYGRIVCHCERVTRGEIIDAARTPVPARTLDGVRRRTRALFGRCQGFYCAAHVAQLLAEASGQSVTTLIALREP